MASFCINALTFASDRSSDSAIIQVIKVPKWGLKQVGDIDGIEGVD